MSGPQIICCGAQIILLSKEGESLLNCTPSLLSGSHSNEERAQIAFSAVKGLSFLHSRRIFLGNNLTPDKILIIKENEKIHSIFRSESPALQSDSSLATRGGWVSCCWDFLAPKTGPRTGSKGGE